VVWLGLVEVGVPEVDEQQRAHGEMDGDGANASGSDDDGENETSRGSFGRVPVPVADKRTTGFVHEADTMMDW
jgi:hypothetical protein